MPHDRTGKSLRARVSQPLAALLLVVCAAVPLAAASPADQYSLAATHYQHSRWQLAIAEFDTLLAEHADYQLAADARFFAAEASMQLAEYDSAARRLEAFLADHASHAFAPQAQFRRGECDYFRGQQAQARQHFEAFVKDHPRHELLEYALPYLGELCLTAGDPQRAQSHYQQALETFPSGRMADQCRFGLAQALESQGDRAAAERFYRSLAGDAQSPLAGDAKLRLAALLIEQGKHDQAIEYLRQVIADQSLSPWHAEANYLLLKTRHAQGKWPEVVAIFERALAEQNEASYLDTARFLTAEAELRLNHAEAARRLYGKVIESSTDPTLRNDSLIELFSLELSAGESQSAAAALAKLTSLAGDDPRVSQLQRMWVVDCISREDYAEAKRFLEGLSPSQAVRLRGEVAYFMALVALGERDFDAALAQLDRLELAELPADTRASARFARAAALMHLKRYAEALEPLEAYLQTSADGADAPRCREYLALALAHEGRWSEAAAAHARLKQEAHGERYVALTHQLAGLALAADQPTHARQWYEELAAAEAQAPAQIVSQALAALAWLERSDGNQASSPALSRLLEQFPQSELAQTALLDAARAAASRGDSAQALAKYHRLLDRFPDSRCAAEGLLGAALIYDRLDQPREAGAIWTLLLAHPQGDTFRDTARYNLAWSLLAQERADEAYAHLAELAREDRQSKYWVDASLRLAQREHGQHDTDSAKHRLASILQRDLTLSEAAHAHYLAGTIAAERKDWPAVARAMEQVIEAGDQHPLYRAASYWQAEALYQLRQYQQAEAKLAQLAQDTAQAEPWEAMIPLRQAQCLAHRKQWPAAERLVRSIAERFPDFDQQYEADYLLGRCLAAQAQLEEARAAYQRAMTAPLAAGTETAAMASWMIGETYFHGRDYEQALRAYYRTAEFSAYPVWRAAALLQAGKCHEVRGEWDKAAQRYAELLAISPPTRFHAEAEQRRSAARQRSLAQSESTSRTR